MINDDYAITKASRYIPDSLKPYLFTNISYAPCSFFILISMEANGFCVFFDGFNRVNMQVA
jgi:hypothetical protein